VKTRFLTFLASIAAISSFVGVSVTTADLILLLKLINNIVEIAQQKNGSGRERDPVQGAKRNTAQGNPSGVVSGELKFILPVLA
ncbi:unnamed protein product, partial [Acanthoscelides obtectus]